VFTLLGYQALHIAIGTGMAIWCLVRVTLGMLDRWRCLTLRVCLLWWRFTVATSAFTLLLVVGFPDVVS
jgi:cytochrome c oxidase subunit I+III